MPVYFGSKPEKSSMGPHCKLARTNGDLLEDAFCYRRLIGRILYLTNTRSDITFAVHHLSQFLDTPRLPYMQATLRILRYIKNAPGQCIFFFSTSSPIHVKTLLTLIGEVVQILEGQFLDIAYFLMNH